MAPPKPAAKSAAPPPPKKILEAIRDATGANDDEISAMLAECNYDVNEATSRLIDSERPQPARPPRTQASLSRPLALLLCWPAPQTPSMWWSARRTSARRWVLAAIWVDDQMWAALFAGVCERRRRVRPV
jgi:hypothetical protein